MLEKLKEEVCRQNLELVRHGLVIFTWGNVSGIDRETGLFVIKPSGVRYDELKPEHMVVLDLEGNTVEGGMRPSSDTATHLELYRENPAIGGIVHTHSCYATAFAQSGRAIPAYGTTHADHFYGEIPCVRALTKDEIDGEYEKNTGAVINEAIDGENPLAVPGCLVRSHGPFAWGKDAAEAVVNAAVLEQLARMALFTEQLNAQVRPVDQSLLDRHYFRKHGENAYYGQK